MLFNTEPTCIRKTQYMYVISRNCKNKTAKNEKKAHYKFRGSGLIILELLELMKGTLQSL